MKRKNMAHFITVAAAAFILTSCAGAIAPQDSRDMLQAPGMTLWQSQGYGYLLGMQGDAFTCCDMTQVSLLCASKGRIEQGRLMLDDDLFIGQIIERTEQQIIFQEPDGTKIVLKRIEAIPDAITITRVSEDAAQNFEVFWHTIEEQSAMLSMKHVDWRAAYRALRPDIAKRTPESLFTGFVKLMVLLRDGHGVISNGKSSISSFPYPPSAWLKSRRDDLLAAIATYTDQGSLQASASDNMLSGTIHHNIGYLNVLSFYGYSQTNNEDEDEAMFAAAIDKLLGEWQSMDALILDLRLNDGGSDALALSLANRLTSKRIPVFSKQARIGGYDEFSPLQERFIEPAGVQFLGKPVIVLTSGLTISAADVAAMILKHPDLTNVTTVGEPSFGAFSNALGKTLPNGWMFMFSNERYFAAFDQQNYEGKGIAPDVEVMQDETALNQGKDNILDAALRQLSH